MRGLIDRSAGVCYAVRTELQKNNSNKRSRRMKKLSIIAVTLLVAGTLSSWAQSNIINTTSNEVAGFVVGPLPISFTGKLSNKTTITASTLADLAPGGGTLEFAEGYDVEPLSTGQVRLVIGTSFGTSNIVTIVSGVTNINVTAVGYTILVARDYVDPSASKSVKFTSGWEGAGDGTLNGTSTNFSSTVDTVVSNATLLISGTISPTSSGGKSSTNATAATDFKISAKVTGVWFDGVDTISGSIGAPKK
jgi:uncharacterized membrane protein